MRPVHVGVSFAFLALAPALRGQCFDWSPSFGSGPGLRLDAFFEATVHAAEVFDDGSGAKLFVAGDFTHADGVEANGIASWDGSRWSALVDGLRYPNGSGNAKALVVHDDGNGAALYVGGGFTSAGGVPAANVARWNGTHWSTPGTGLAGAVVDLAQGDLGSGPTLFAATTSGLHAWDGAAWQTLATVSGWFTAIETFDDGSGPALYTAGHFFDIGGVSASGLARWDGAAWSATDSGLGDGVLELEVVDDLGFPSLCAAGHVNVSAGVVSVARWNGASWDPVGPSLGWVEALGVRHGASGALLVAGGAIFGAGQLATFDGVGWTTIPGLALEGHTWEAQVHAVTEFDDGSGAALFVGGQFDAAGAAPAHGVARWDGAWSGVGAPASGADASVHALALFDQGQGEALYAGGDFASVAGTAASRVARWDGSTWSPLGSGLSDTVEALLAFDDGGGPALYAAGNFLTAGGGPALRVARWNGAAWSSVGAGFNGNVRALAAFDDGQGEKLYAGGDFTASGATPLSRIARWDGATWQPVGSGLSGFVAALEVFDLGAGPALVAGGDFLTAGGAAALRVASWNGTAWSPIGDGFNGRVLELETYDDGTTRRLVAGGDFLSSGNESTRRIAHWNGSAWVEVCDGALGRITALGVYDDGPGPRLFVAHQETAGTGLKHVFRWDGSACEELALLDGRVLAMASFREGAGPAALYLGGEFSIVGAVGADRIARYGPDVTCAPAGYCTAGTTGSGCAAHIRAHGQASRSLGYGCNVFVDDVEGSKAGLIFFGVEGPHAAPWGAGTSVLCVRAPVVRTPIQNSGGAHGTCEGQFSLDLNEWLAAQPGQAPPPGSQVWMQAWFRDPPSPKSTSLSDGATLWVAP